MKKNILFVCIENSNRSQMAHGFAVMYGNDKVNAFSAGSRPSGKINPKAIASMNELGYDMSKHQSKSLEELPMTEFEFAITMGCGDECPLIKARYHEDWNIPDPRYMNDDDFRKVRDLIRNKVRELLARLEARSGNFV